MKTIEELAKECGAYIETGENDEHLEALCKAYMQDRLSELEPVAWIYKEDDTFDGEKWKPKKNATLSKQLAIWKDKNAKPLHYISSLLEKA